jgi:predicted nucleic acid-binding protein
LILADTSVWVDHLRAGDSALSDLLDKDGILVHPFVLGEISLGNLTQRPLILAMLANLPRPEVATDDEVLDLIDRETLFGAGIGYIDAHLLAAVRLTAGAALWTRDRRLRDIAGRLGAGVPWE